MAAEILGLRYNSPHTFTAGQRFILNLGAPLIAAGVRSLLCTCRYEVLGLGILSVRGSSSRGGSEALRDLAIALDHVPVVGLTVDGPRGPRRVAKPGVAILAARTGAPIIPHAFAVRPAWRLRSWDRFSIAKPFAHVVSVYGPAIPPPANASPAAIEETRLEVETSLNQLHQQIEAALGIESDAPRCEPEKPAYADTSSNR